MRYIMIELLFLKTLMLTRQVNEMSFKDSYETSPDEFLQKID